MDTEDQQKDLDLSQSQFPDHQVPSTTPNNYQITDEVKSTLSSTLKDNVQQHTSKNCFIGFQTASGKNVVVSQEGLKIARALFSGIDDNEQNNVSINFEEDNGNHQSNNEVNNKRSTRRPTFVTPPPPLSSSAAGIDPFGDENEDALAEDATAIEVLGCLEAFMADDDDDDNWTTS